MNIRVAITADLNRSLFSNGINQNALYLAMVYQEMGADVDIIAPGSDNEASKQLDKLGVKLPILRLSESLLKTYDVIITLGFVIENTWYGIWKNSNPDLKLVSYKCGNELLTDMEAILYGIHEERVESFKDMKYVKPDVIWSIPQMESTNLDYYKFTQHQDNATVVPFVWDPILIESYKNTTDFTDWTERPIETAAIMEPNLGIMKNLLPPLIILDRFVNTGGKLKHLFAFSTQKLSKNKRLISILKSSKSKLITKLSAEGRKPTIEVLNKHADFVVSWQLENNLNYLYLDIAWLGWPIIHNANLCQDIGYYYPNTDAVAGAEQIKLAQNTHNTEYKEEQRSRIKRYTKENKTLIEQYKKLTEDLLSDNFIKYKYTWKTNQINE